MAAIISAAAFVWLFLWSKEALAWGPVTHVELVRSTLSQGLSVLDFISSAGIEVFWGFIYGSLAPDLFLAKNRQLFEHHTHNWARALSMSRAAVTPREMAFCLGYQTHLAADVVAHNIYVPYKLVESPYPGTRKHTYWEVRFEYYQPIEAWELIEAIRALDFSDLHSFLEKHQRPTYLPFATNLALTRGLASASTGRTARRLLERMEQGPGGKVANQEVRMMMDLSLSKIKSVLVRGEDSPVCGIDPRGLDSIKHALELNSSIKKLGRRWILARSHYRSLAEATARNFRISLINEQLDDD